MFCYKLDHTLLQVTQQYVNFSKAFVVGDNLLESLNPYDPSFLVFTLLPSAKV